MGHLVMHRNQSQNRIYIGRVKVTKKVTKRRMEKEMLSVRAAERQVTKLTKMLVVIHWKQAYQQVSPQLGFCQNQADSRQVYSISEFPESGSTHSDTTTRSTQRFSRSMTSCSTTSSHSPKSCVKQLWVSIFCSTSSWPDEWFQWSRAQRLSPHTVIAAQMWKSRRFALCVLISHRSKSTSASLANGKIVMNIAFLVEDVVNPIIGLDALHRNAVQCHLSLPSTAWSEGSSSSLQELLLFIRFGCSGFSQRLVLTPRVHSLFHRPRIRYHYFF